MSQQKRVMNRPSGSRFNPLTYLGSNRAWYDAADTSTISLGTGSNVAQWDDKGPYGYDLTQGTAVNQPESGIDSQGGRNVVSFDSTGPNYLYNASGATHASGATFFFVAEFNPATGVQIFIDSSSLYRMFRALSDELKSYRGGSAENASPGVFVADNVPAVMSFTLDVGSPNNNTIMGNGNEGSHTNSKASTMTNYYVGASNSLSLPHDGWIGEIIIYDGVFTDAQRAPVENYLRRKWGITY